MFWASLGSATLWRLVVDKQRERASARAGMDVFAGCKAKAIALLLHSLLAMTGCEGRGGQLIEGHPSLLPCEVEMAIPGRRVVNPRC